MKNYRKKDYFRDDGEFHIMKHCPEPRMLSAHTHEFAELVLDVKVGCGRDL